MHNRHAFAADESETSRKRWCLWSCPDPHASARWPFSGMWDDAPREPPSDGHPHLTLHAVEGASRSAQRVGHSIFAALTEELLAAVIPKVAASKCELSPDSRPGLRFPGQGPN